MKDSLIYLTGNAEKLRIAELVFADSRYRLVRQSVATPELQSTSVREIAEYSARWAARTLPQPFFLTDAAFQITALGGFPGPFVKYINQWFSAEDYLRLMVGKDDREVVIEDCLAYSEPGKAPLLFSTRYYGRIASEPGQPRATAIDRLFIPDGFGRPLADFPVTEQRAYWSAIGVWNQLKAHLQQSWKGSDSNEAKPI